MRNAAPNVLKAALALVLATAGAVSFGGDWQRIVAVDQATTNVVMVSAAPGAGTNVFWRWSPAADRRIRPEHVRAFANLDECKPLYNGEMMLVCASGGGIALVDMRKTACVWYAISPKNNDGPHSVALLPDGRAAVANSVGCDKLEIFDTRRFPFDPAKQPHVYAADIPHAHGVAWNARRNSLFVLGSTNVYEFAYIPERMGVVELRRWRYDVKAGDGFGHDFTPDAQGGYFMTNHSGVWRFDPETGDFTRVREERGAKSFSRDWARGDLLVIPRKRWWTDRLLLVEPNGRRRVLGPFPGARFYKARWMSADARRLLWRDEFGGASLDTNIWARIDKGASDWNRAMSTRPDLVEVRDGMLVLKGVANSDTNADPRPFLTGGVRSVKGHFLGIGRAEIRAKFEDHQKGAWPALWMCGCEPDDLGRGWPWNGEIDIVERLEDCPEVLHTVFSGWTYHKQLPAEPPHRAAPIKNGAWHVYALEKTHDVVTMFVDGKETFRYRRRLDACDADHWPFDKKFFFYLDMQLGCRWTTAHPTDLATLPVNMYIDWIRVYE